MRFGGMVLVSALALGACSSDPVPRQPDDDATTSASPTPTAPPPTRPAQASEDSPEGAAAFVDYYVRVFNYAAATGDVAELSRLSAPSCDGCQRYIDLYRDTYEAGGYFRGGDWRIGEIGLRSAQDSTLATTAVRSGGARFKMTSADEEKLSSTATTKVTFELQGSNVSRVIREIVVEQG
jgi:hypothetical protein